MKFAQSLNCGFGYFFFLEFEFCCEPLKVCSNSFLMGVVVHVKDLTLPEFISFDYV